MKQSYRLLLLLGLLFLAIQPTLANEGGFYYKDFNVKAVVSKNNSWDITETITVHFNEPRHGIYRYIPMQFRFDRNLAAKGEKENIQTLTFTSDVYNIDVTNETVDISTDNSNKVIRIGDEDETITGDHVYVIKYTYTYPDDRLRDMDYVYHTILGTNFEEPIEHFSFDVSFEKNLSDEELSNIELSSGAIGDTANLANCELWIDNGHLCCEANNIPPHQGITFYIPLREGYFEGVEVASDTMMNLFLVLTLISALMLVFFMLRLNKPSITKQIEFYPPEGISSAEVGYIIDSTLDDIDLGSLIPWFASKGYVSIKEIDEKKLIGKKTVLELTKKKELPSNAPEYQKTFMKALFKKQSKVRLDEIEAKPELVNKAKSQLVEVFTGDKTLTNWHGAVWIYLLIVIFSSLSLAFSSVQLYAFDDNIFTALLAWTTPFSLGIVTKIITAKKQMMRSKIANYLILVGKFIVMVLVFCISFDFFVSPDNMLSESIFMTLTIICFILAEFVDRFCINTKYRADLMGKLLGFKEFIKTADKPRLEMMLADDPSFFYKVLPYALVFDLTEVWAKHFKDIDMEQPDWITCAGVYHASTFARSFSETISTASNSAVSVMSPSSSGVGGISVGGGGGGGGGGSW